MPEYVTGSNRPGIGADWYSAFGYSDCHQQDSVHVEGKEYRPPRYYDRLLERANPTAYARIKKNRLLKVKESDMDLTLKGQKAKNALANRKMAREARRSYEDGQ